MKLRYLGLFLIIIGFACPFILRMVFPTFLNAHVPTVLCFWAGFLFVLRPLDSNNKFNHYLKYARYGVIINIALTISLAGYVNLFLYFDIRKGIVIDLMRFLSFIVMPIQTIFNMIVTPPMVQLPDGAIQVTNTFSRSLLTGFFNLLFYALSGMFVKIIKDKKITSVFSGSQGPCAR